MKDLHNAYVVEKALETIVVNNDTEGTGDVVDLQDYEGAELIAVVGESGDVLSGSVLITLKIQEGDESDGSDMADVAQADLLGAPDGAAAGVFAVIDDPAEDGAVFRVGYIGEKRYIRIFADVTGTHTNGTPIGAAVVLGHGRHTPPGLPAV